MYCYLLILISACILLIEINALNIKNPTTDLQSYVFETTPQFDEKTCPKTIAELKNTIYILYDVNPPEGFNLRRDVYIRLAVFVQKLQKKKLFNNVRLVLPPWRRLFHWKSNHLSQDNLLWKQFFNIESMRRYAPILDFDEFLHEISLFGLPESPYVPVHKIFQLMHFEDMFEDGAFHDKYEFTECRKEQYQRSYLLQQSILLDNDFLCLKFQGSSSMLERVLRQSMASNDTTNNEPKVYAFLNAEIVLHDSWGDVEFWKARRSMRFAPQLLEIADKFRMKHFRTNNSIEEVQRPPMWEFEKEYRSALGGRYLCAHLRRGDFVFGREKTTPTLKSVAVQIRDKLKYLNLTTVFLATDATAFEMQNLKSYLQRVRPVRYSTDSLEQKSMLKDGGIAIIDQIICSHAAYFIGTYESTFTYRIYEEREIMGFPKMNTFNTFCKSEDLSDCSKNSVWPIVY
ncbi:GDP-fucose protein O-fucosyltransferase 2 [Teleopsis dalmanni]|uniref:GDP-fucose protein O-fucosyltransferase 2 n=1 Tax=Teleopsis dalmanni TaxID=139649 RepID=UPI0018CD43A6|nr:GDP-fucose protein O-fucosyltransferase 2 [Teleopsis dalmanni]